jgi:hypothetical protein
MPRQALIVEIQPEHLAALGYLTGLLTGQGVPQAQLVADLLNSVQQVEVPDDFGPEQLPEVEDDNESDDEELPETEGELIAFPSREQSEALDAEPVGGDLPAIDPLSDPTSPESLGIELNKPNPWGAPAPAPASNQEDFGAGPPPTSGD